MSNTTFALAAFASFASFASFALATFSSFSTFTTFALAAFAFVPSFTFVSTFSVFTAFSSLSVSFSVFAFVAGQGRQVELEHLVLLRPVRVVRKVRTHDRNQNGGEHKKLFQFSHFDNF